MRLSDCLVRLRWVVPIFALACLAIVAVALIRPSKPPPFRVLRQPVQRPVLFRDHLGAWIPTSPGWAWAWRIEQAVFGKRKPVNISAHVIEFSEAHKFPLSNFLPEQPSFSDAGGLQVWLLGADRCKTLGEQLKQSPGTALLSQPRISTADGIDSKLFQGNSITLHGTSKPVGLTLACFARVHRKSTDLIACFNHSEAVANPAAALGSRSVSEMSVQTNLDAEFRLQVPKGSGFFLFDAAPPKPAKKRIGVLVDPL
jgi:hypothetical protein